MKLNRYNQLYNDSVCDDWGWFIDIETTDNSKNILLQLCKPIMKKNNLDLNKLPPIEEDEYEYYHENYEDPEENYDIILKPSNEIGENNINENVKRDSNILDVGSTTFITAVLTYIIFIIL